MFAALSTVHSPSGLGLVLAVASLASMLGGPFGGVPADRIPRQMVMLASGGVRAAMQVVMGGLLVTGTAGFGKLLL